MRKPDETSGDQVGHFWSWHGDGAHFAFGDASVRFLGYGIDSRVLTALGTANGGESVSGY